MVLHHKIFEGTIIYRQLIVNPDWIALWSILTFCRERKRSDVHFSVLKNRLLGFLQIQVRSCLVSLLFNFVFFSLCTLGMLECTIGTNNFQTLNIIFAYSAWFEVALPRKTKFEIPEINLRTVYEWKESNIKKRNYFSILYSMYENTSMCTHKQKHIRCTMKTEQFPKNTFKIRKL